MKYEHIFFDLDRTLWDYDANAYKALCKIFFEFELDKHFSSPEEFFEIYTKHNDQLWEDYRNGAIRKDDLRKLRFHNTLKEKKVDNVNLCNDIGDLFLRITPKQNMLISDTISTLNYLVDKKYSLYILTNGFIKTQKNKMVNSKIDHFFLRIFSSEEFGVNKPRKEIFHWAVSSIHAKKTKCLMVGDDLKVDIRGAMNYGIDGAWFNPDNSPTSFKPTFTLSKLHDLRSIL
ncbi:YjjG family noncanonical pyrimidine nucleotidase [Bacteroidota bacterium]